MTLISLTTDLLFLSKYFHLILKIFFQKNVSNLMLMYRSGGKHCLETVKTKILQNWMLHWHWHLLSRPKTIQHCRRPGFTYQILGTLLLQYLGSLACCIEDRRLQLRCSATYIDLPIVYNAEWFLVWTKDHHAMHASTGHDAVFKHDSQVSSQRPWTIIFCIFSASSRRRPQNKLA